MAASVAPAAPRVPVPDPPRQEVKEAAPPPIAAEPPPEPAPQQVDRAREVALVALAQAQAEREEAARVDAERVVAERRERERQAQREAARQEQEQELRREAARQEAIERELAAQEQARQEQASREQAQREQAASEQAAREQAAKEQAAREQERASQAQAAQSPSQQAPAVQGQPAPLAPREERLRAIAEQFAREAAQRSPPGAPQPTVSGQRRGWLFGRADPNQDLVLYAQAMSRKIEMNMTLDMVREAVKQPHTQPVVTVAVRADGSVEKVTFVTSSGVAAIDEGIRQIIASQAPFGPFPPALARQYDVVEIRRSWLFDVAVRLQ